MAILSEPVHLQAADQINRIAHRSLGHEPCTLCEAVGAERVERKQVQPLRDALQEIITWSWLPTPDPEQVRRIARTALAAP